jgi:tetratricopeptide (TPR) repeat protein
VSSNPEQLPNARMLTLSGDYQSALAIVSQILVDEPLNIEALRLRGNILELSVLGAMQPVLAEDRAKDLDLALSSYETILRISPGDTLAMKDLADHYNKFRDKRYALGLYSQLISVLREQEEKGQDVGEELRDAIEDSEILKHEIS